jgi:hypothetical protein
VSRNWFAYLQVDWTQLKFDDRDLRTVPALGGAERTPVSISYESRVRTRPFIFTPGIGRAWHSRAVRFAIAANAVIAPLKVEDFFNVYLDTEHDSEVSATGTGFGYGGTVTMDYLTDTNMTLFLEGFFRVGGTDVELDSSEWESPTVPGTRTVDFTGGGLRLGFRWT